MILNIINSCVFWVGLGFIVFFTIRFLIAICKLRCLPGPINWKQVFAASAAKEKRDFIIGVLTFIIAFLAYFKANEFLDTWLLFQISDRCLTANIKINEETGTTP